MAWKARMSQTEDVAPSLPAHLPFARLLTNDAHGWEQSSLSAGKPDAVAHEPGTRQHAAFARASTCEAPHELPGAWALQEARSTAAICMHASAMLRLALQLVGSNCNC